MIESFLKELKDELKKLNADNIDSIIENYKEKCESLKNSGMSDIEIILNFGDTKELAYTICGYNFTTHDRLLNNTLEEIVMEKKKDNKKIKSKSEVYLSDALFFAPGIILSIIGVIALAFVAGLTLVASSKYLYFSWVDVNIQNRGLAFTMAIFGVVIGILGLFLTYILCKKVYLGSKKYMQERKEALASLNNLTDNNIDKENNSIDTLDSKENCQNCCEKININEENQDPNDTDKNLSQDDNLTSCENSEAKDTEQANNEQQIDIEENQNDTIIK